jgi:hypothetical protein
VAAVAVVGAVTALFAGIIAGITNCKQISDGMVEGYSYMQFKDHTDKIGYQHAVRHSDPAVWCCYMNPAKQLSCYPIATLQNAKIQ